MAIDLPEPFDRSLIANHTFSCALTTRGGICDCLPPPAEGTGPTTVRVKAGSAIRELQRNRDSIAPMNP
jgi:hypothetical protein